MRIDVQTGGTSRGLRDARAGLAHISMVSRNVKEADLIPFTIAVIGWLSSYIGTIRLCS